MFGRHMTGSPTVTPAARRTAPRAARAWVPLVLAMALAAGATPRADEIIDRMLAVVAGDLIMMSDVAAAVEFGLVPQTSGDDVTRLVLSQLIDRSLMLAEVDRYAPQEPSTDAVDRELSALRDRFPSPQAYLDALARFGVEEASLRQTLRANLRLRAYLEQRFAAVPPSDDDVRDYYGTHRDRFTVNGAVQPLDAVRADVLQALSLDRRQAMVDEWLAGLRRRATITDVYLTSPR